MIFNANNFLITADIILLALLVIISVSIALFRNLIIITVVMCTFSLLMALIHLVIGAPDVAITEASVGACISTVFTLLALTLIKKRKTNATNNYFIPLVVSIATFLALMYTVSDFPKFGNYESQSHKHVAPYYIDNTDYYIGIPNLVTAILADFRGYDTLCETIVIFISSLGISLLLTQDKDRNSHD